MNVRSLINNIDSDYNRNTKTTNTINMKNDALETLKQSSSNFDKLTNHRGPNLNPEVPKKRTNPNTKTTDFKPELDKINNDFICT